MRTLFAFVMAGLMLSTQSHAVLSLESLGNRAFSRTCTLTSAAGATAVHCLAAADVPSGAKAYLTGMIAKVNGSTAYGTIANCYVKDTASSPVTMVTMAAAGLTANAVLTLGSASNVTLADPVALGTGATAAKGLDIVCNATGTGSDLVVTVVGVLK